MADTFLNYEKQCKDTQGHIKRIYVLPFVFYPETLIKSEGMNLTVFPTSTVYRFDCWGNYSQSTTTEKGNVQWSHSIEINLPKVYEVYDINIFYRNDFRIIVETNNGHLIMFGTNNGLQCEISNNSGNSKTEFNGFTLTFTGIEEKPGLLISTLGDFFNVYGDSIGGFGALYNWHAATDVRNIAPVGFHVPSKSEYETLLNEIDLYDAINEYWPLSGGLLKDTSSSYWNSPNTGATNEYGFNIRGSGGRDGSGFWSIKEEGYFWLEDESIINPDNGLIAAFTKDAEYAGTSDNGSNKKEGYGLRFIADSGTPTTATQNNGEVIPCVTIGTQTWTSVNSTETKYQNGEYITGYDGGVYTPISNEAWAALETEAMCFYDDDETKLMEDETPEALNEAFVRKMQVAAGIIK